MLHTNEQKYDFGFVFFIWYYLLKETFSEFNTFYVFAILLVFNNILSSLVIHPHKT